MNNKNSAYSIVKELEDNGVYSNTPEKLVDSIKKAIENNLSGQQIFALILTNTNFQSVVKNANQINIINEVLESFGI